VHRTPFDLVLMDVQMPVLDGLAATERIRAHPPSHGRPRIIALTANAMVDDRVASLRAGMDGFLAKPIREAELEAVLAGAARAEVAPVVHDSEAGVLSKMERAARDGDTRNLARLAHGLKGSSATLGASRFAALCADVENSAHHGPPAAQPRDLYERAHEVGDVMQVLSAELTRA
jgi:DNA-binding response OmpR family regulator